MLIQKEKEIIQREQAYWSNIDDFKYLTDISIDQILSKLPQPKGDVLELFSGSGMFSERFEDTYETLTCCDISSALLDKLKNKLPHVKTLHGNIYDLDLPNEAYDQIFVFAGLHHVPNYEIVLKKCASWLKPGGAIITFEPNVRCWFRLPMLPFRGLFKVHTTDEVFLDPLKVQQQMKSLNLHCPEISYFNPKTIPYHSNSMNKVLTKAMFVAGGLASGILFSPWFSLVAEKPKLNQPLV